MLSEGDEKFSLDMFTEGAKWMWLQMNRLSGKRTVFNEGVNYTAYGWLKYAACISCFLLAVLIFSSISILLAPLAVIIFYLAEVHFLFLFPLLIDGTKYPVRESIKQTYRLGLLQTMLTVLQLGVFVIAGLFNFSRPLRNWYIACLAIIIWYQHEVRNRL